MFEKQTGELDLEFFAKINFEKKQCVKCGSYFWTKERDRKTCGDPPCDSYSFIDNSPTKRSYSNDEMRAEFINFFKDGHKFVKPYPVVPRWRDDVLLVNASIYDFQPQVTSGMVQPPGNPLVMSQPSIRMVDVDLVGRTGRHLTSFEMMCHDAFNYEDNYVYWKEETVNYCHGFLTDQLRIEPALITYKEKPWSGGGNGGNAFEVFISGLEVATLVFMDLKEDKNGEYVIDGKRYSKMSMKVVDTGYGLERLTWLSRGTDTVYEAIYPEIMEFILEKSDANLVDGRIMQILVTTAALVEPYDESIVIDMTMKKLKENGIEISRADFIKEFDIIKSAFIIADHSRSLLVMFSDYVIPSNVKVGYLARLLIRRALRHMKEINFSGSLEDLIDMHWKQLGNILTNYPKEFIGDVLAQEREKYDQVLKKGESVVSRILEKEGKITTEDLVKLYDSSGLYPEFIASVVKEKTGKEIKIPQDFHAMVLELHAKEEAEEKTTNDFPELETRPLYYDDTSIMEFTGLVLYSKDNMIILNQSAFYPEGGGQPWDLGYFSYKGKKINVAKVEKHGKAIVHYLESPIPEHARVIGHIDHDRRRQLMIHHSSTHLLLGALRQVLGEHIWQSGVQKDVNSSRIDVTHYRKITQEEIRAIERKCLEIITQGRNIRVANVDWNKALAKYGFRLFQGGVPLSKKIRVVEIEGVDVEGCGGTHLNSTSEIGFLKILSAESIQEGIQRITFVAGPAALEYVQKISDISREVQSTLAVEIGETIPAFRRMFAENIELKKQKEKILKDTVKRIVESSSQIDSRSGTARMVSGAFTEEELKGISKMLPTLGKGVYIIKNRLPEKNFRYMVISTSKADSREILHAIPNIEKDKISGSERFASVITEVDIGEKLIKGILDSM